MNSFARGLAVATAPFVTLALLALASIPPAVAQQLGVSKPGTTVVLRAGPPGLRPTFVQPTQAQSLARRAPTKFKVKYHGFSPEAQEAFQRAVDNWAVLVASDVPINVDATFKRLPTNVLGSAGPGTFYENFPGATHADRWYASALANKLTASQLDSDPDIIANFSSNFRNWHFGAGPAPAGDFDFTTVVMHELGHGLGFIGLGDVVGSDGTVRFSGLPAVYSDFVENGGGRPILRFADPSAKLGAQLQSNNLFFNSRKVRRANGGSAAKIYAPDPFEPGSSYSHLDEATFPAGDPNSLMTPVLSPGETIRDPGNITLGIFQDIGW